MRSLLRLTILALLLVVPQLGLANSTPPAAGVATLAESTMPRPLLLPLPQPLELPALVEVTAWVDGRSVARETLEIPTVLPMEESVIEALALHPQLRRELWSGERGPSEAIWISVQVDGGEWVYSLDEAAAITDDLLGRAVLPVSFTVVDESVLATPGMVPGGSLVFCHQCWFEYDLCESRCLQPPNEECLLRCQSELDICFDSCVDCPAVEEWIVTELFSETYVGPTICREDFTSFGQGKYYERKSQVHKVTRYRKTTFCDGTSTTVVVSITYTPAVFCWRKTGSPCAPFGAIPAPICF